MQISKIIEIQKMIRDIKRILNHRTYDGYLLVFNTMKYFRDTQNVYFEFNLINNKEHASICGIFNIVLKNGLHVDTVTYDTDKRFAGEDVITRDLLNVIKKHLDCPIELTPIKIDFLKEREKAIDALNRCEAHLLNVPDKNITVSDSLFHAFKIDDVMYISNLERYL